MANQLFAKKSLKVLLDEMAGDHRLRRVLGPVALSALGIGAIIGTGIFVLTGLAARNYAGPGLIMSFVIAGTACAFAALCYAEFASMAPVAGSAYTYAYTTLGELMAWIIGWDLVLEYAMGSATVANGWSNYFIKFLGMFKDPATGKAFLTIPLWLSTDPFTAAEQHKDYQAAKTVMVASATGKVEEKSYSLPIDIKEQVFRMDSVKVEFTPESIQAVRAQLGDAADGSIKRVKKALEDSLTFDPAFDPAKGKEPAVPLTADAARALKLTGVAGDYEKGSKAYEETPIVIGGLHITFNLIAVVITVLITVLLVVGIRESAGFNALMVLVKVVAVIFVIVAGIAYVDTTNWTPFMPYGWTGVLGAAGVIFFAYIGFDSVSTHAEEAINPSRDVPIGILSSLAVCTILYILVAGVITGMVPYPQIPLNAPIAGAFESKGLGIASAIITIGALTGITSVLLVMLLSQPRILMAMARDGLLPQRFFGVVHPRFRTPHRATILTGLVCMFAASLFPLEALGHMVSIGTLFAFVVVCAAVLIMRYKQPEAKRPFRTPMLQFVAPAGIVLCLAMMVYLGWENWVRLFAWLAIGLVIYFVYSRHHSHLGKELRSELSRHGASPAGSPLDGPQS